MNLSPTGTPAQAPPTIQWLGRLAYADGLRLQEALQAQRLKGEIPDQILLLEHEPVYTIGRTRDRSSLRGETALPHPVVEISRGGQATYHGPGQLVGYLILDLRAYAQDLHAYLRQIEQALLDFCSSLGIAAQRREGLTGIWVENRKLASIGVGVRNWVTLHGFALNVCGDLSPFAAITPCGIAGVEMTSLEKEQVAITVQAAASLIPPFLLGAMANLARNVNH